VTADDLLEIFGAAADAQAAAVAPLEGKVRRARTERAGQYALDVVADAAVLAALAPAGAHVLSEESGWTGPEHAAVTIVVDPVDGSTNCARQIPYWAISLCALDADGLWCALVANQATGERFTAVRGGGAWCDGRPVKPSMVTRPEDSVMALAGIPKHILPWKQFRALGSGALTLCDVADGRVDGFVDSYAAHAPWDYLGGLLVCQEAGAVVVDAQDRPLLTIDADARRAMLAASTPELLDAMRGAW